MSLKVVCMASELAHMVRIMGYRVDADVAASSNSRIDEMQTLTFIMKMNIRRHFRK